MLEVHSHFSFGRGCHSVASLARAAQSRGWKAISLCDDRGLYGMVDLHRAARELAAEGCGILPVLGVRLPRLGGALILAEGREGLAELCQLVSLDHLGPGWETRPPQGWSTRDIPLHGPADGDEDDEGAADEGADEAREPDSAVLSSCTQEERPSASDIAGVTPAEDWRLALLEACRVLRHCQLVLPAAALAHFCPAGRPLFLPEGAVSVALDPAADRRQANALWQEARRLGLPVVPHAVVDYLDASDAELHQRIRAMHENCSRERVLATRRWNARGALLTPEELLAPFSTLPAARRRLEELWERCPLGVETGTLHLPRPPNSLEDDVQRLGALCEAALPRLYPAPGPWRRRGPQGQAGSVGTSSLEQARQRLHQELEVIGHLGFAGYFLVVHEITSFVKERGLPMIGRGSAANSLVSYLLGFTEVDPLRHRLSFERFLNPWRSTPPDIDLDFSWADRDEVLRFVLSRFGARHAALLSTTVTLGPRGALRELAKVEGLAGRELDELTRTFPRGVHDWEEELAHTGRHGLRADAEPLAGLLPWVRRLVGLPRHLGIHVGGVLITPDPITRWLPLQRAGRGVTVTQLDMHPVEELGLLKIDLLAQRGLGVHADLLRQDAAAGRVAPPLTPYELEVEPATAALVREGRTMGCFYIESPGMQALLRKLRCGCFEDLVAASSIIRPGVSESGMMQAFIRHHRAVAATPAGEPWPVDFLHPLLRDLLEDTYGVMVYQEDVMHVVAGLAGMSLAEADLLRRAMSGKGTDKVALATFEARFHQGCAARGVPGDIAAELWRQISSFAGYAFCKAHSASFAVLSYRLAWYKAHRPAEFMAAVLSNQGGFFSSAAYVQEARRLGLMVQGPCVVHGQDRYTGGEGRLRVGLQQVKGLQRATRRRLLEERSDRPFSGLGDFRRRSLASRGELESLAHAGALDALAGRGDPRERRPALLWELRASRQTVEGGMPGLFAEEAPAHAAGRWSWIELWQGERQALGYGISRHPLELFDFGELPGRCVRAQDLWNCVGHQVAMIGWVFARKTIRTRTRHERMAFLSLEDATGTWEAVLFPASWERHALLLRGSGPFLLEGRVELEAEEPMLQVESMSPAGRLSEWSARESQAPAHTIALEAHLRDRLNPAQLE